MVAKRVVGNTIHPINHQMALKFTMSADAASGSYATGIPLITQDEAVDLSATYTNSEHASFAKVNDANCATDSSVDRAFVMMKFTLDKGTTETDKVRELVIKVLPIFTSFGKELDEADTVSSHTVGSLCEMTKEATDKQAYFIYSGTDMPAETGYNSLGTRQTGLTTDSKLESIAFLPANHQGLKDMKQYSREISGLLKKVQPFTITKHVKFGHTQTIIFKKNIDGKVKHMNPYTFCGFIIRLPREDEYPQLVMDGDLTAIPHVIVNYEHAYYEWNENAIHTKQ